MRSITDWKNMTKRASSPTAFAADSHADVSDKFGSVIKLVDSDFYDQACMMGRNELSKKIPMFSFDTGFSNNKLKFDARQAIGIIAYAFTFKRIDVNLTSPSFTMVSQRWGWDFDNVPPSVTKVLTPSEARYGPRSFDSNRIVITEECNPATVLYMPSFVYTGVEGLSNESSVVAQSSAVYSQNAASGQLLMPDLFAGYQPVVGGGTLLQVTFADPGPVLYNYQFTHPTLTVNYNQVVTDVVAAADLIVLINTNYAGIFLAVANGPNSVNIETLTPYEDYIFDKLGNPDISVNLPTPILGAANANFNPSTLVNGGIGSYMSPVRYFAFPDLTNMRISMQVLNLNDPDAVIIANSLMRA